MGTQGQSYALVIMTNKDTYYISQKTAHTLMNLIEDGNAPPFYMFVDAKSGAEVSVSTKSISSVVVRGGQNG